MLERVLSMRRGAPASHQNDDVSKAKKSVSLPLQIQNYLKQTAYIWPCIVITLFVFFVSTYFIRSRDLLCVSSVSSFYPIARSPFFDLDGLDSDFGALGVPWYFGALRIPVVVILR